MLVITQKPGEEFLVGNNVRIVILGAQGGRVKVGVDAPREVVVRRVK